MASDIMGRFSRVCGTHYRNLAEPRKASGVVFLNCPCFLNDLNYYAEFLLSSRENVRKLYVGFFF
jgi:hypothetical protein